MKKRFVALMAAATMVASMISGTMVANAEEDTVKIGLISMITGDNPMNGERMNMAVQLAVDEVNAAGGVLGKQVELLIEDDQTLQDVAVTCVQKLASEDVVGIIGPHRSTNAIAVSDTVKSLEVPVFVGGTSPSISELGNPYMFRGRASDAIFATAAARYATDTLGCKKIGMFYNNDDYGAGAMKVVEQYCADNGIDFVAEGHNTGDKDFTAQIMKMMTEGIDCAIIWTHDPELAIHARQIYELGLECEVVSSPGITMDQVLGMVEADYVEGWYGVTDFIASSTDEEVQKFVDAFEAAYDITPELYASSYYGCAKILLNAIETAGTTDRAAVRDAIAATEGLSVPNGTATCNDTNDLIHNIQVAKVENLTPVFIEAVSAE